MITYSGKALKFNNKWFRNVGGSPTPVDPYNPLGLPPYTLRFQFGEPVADSEDLSCNMMAGYTWTKVDADGYIWDWTYEDPDWSAAWDENQAGPGPVNILGGNTTGVTSMYNLFFRNILASCATFDTSSVENFEGMFTDDFYLTVAPSFDTSSATNIAGMFARTGISSIPDYDLSNVEEAGYAFAYCENVASGALAAYNQLSNNGVCEGHNYTFTDCGKDTVTGAAELAQIPSSWGGTGS